MEKQINEDALKDRMKTGTLEGQSEDAISSADLMLKIQGLIYERFTNGGSVANSSEDNFFCWMTPGVPISASEFDFAKYGLVGLIDAKKNNASTLTSQEKNSEKTDQDNGSSEEDDNTTQEKELSEEEINRYKAERAVLLSMQAENFANMVNFIPDVSGRSESGVSEGLSVLENEGSLYDVYQYALQFSEVMKSELDEETKAAMQRARDLLEVEVDDYDDMMNKVKRRGPSPLVTQYIAKASAYQNAWIEYTNKLIAAQTATDPALVRDWALNGTVYFNKVKTAEADWVTSGYKNQYEKIHAFLNKVETRDMYLLVQQYMDTLKKCSETSLVNKLEFPLTTISPANFADSAGWTKFTFSKTDLSNSSVSEVKNNSVSAKASAGFFASKANYKYGKLKNSREVETTFNLSKIKISFEICQVNIVRPWFKPAFLNSKYWRFDQQNAVTAGQMLSTGGAKPTGMLPAYPTAMIIVRNLTIDFGEGSSAANLIHNFEQENHDASLNLNILGFSAGSNFSYLDNKTHDESAYQFNNTGSTITIPGMQIVGYRCHVLGKSPDPHPDIKEWNKIDLAL